MVINSFVGGGFHVKLFYMINKVKTYIKKHRMLDRGECVVIAVSGGADSVALLKALEILSDEYELKLITAHLNHKLRDEADLEEQLVSKLSNEMGIKYESKKLDIKSLRKGSGKSIEEISRDMRYQFLNDVAMRYHANKIALGHHLNDQIETLLINFLRGSGPEGLKGMMPVRDSLYIRPLLCATREEILSFNALHRIPFMNDASNLESLYLRNRIRHFLIPELKAKFNPNLDEGLSNMAEIVRLEDGYMKMVTDGILSEWDVGADNNEIRIRISELAKHHEAIQNRIFKNILQRLTPHRQGIGYAHIKAVSDLAFSNYPNGCLHLPHNILVRREYDSLIIVRGEKSGRKTMEKKYNEILYEVTLPGLVKIAELRKTVRFDFTKYPVRIKANMQKTVYMDYDRIVPPLIIRTVKPGDWIQPLGMKGKKKIKSCFIDEKIPLSIRKESILLVDKESVIWIAGMKLSERVKITNKTINVLKIEIV